MEFKGIKGKWEATITTPETSNTVEVKKNVASVKCDGITLAICGNPMNDLVNANAKLIAAAPELLEALQEAVIGYNWKKESYPELWDKADDEHYEKCVQAIEKALK